MQTMDSMALFFKQLPEDIHEVVAHHLFSTVECDESDCSEHSLRENKYLATLLQYAKNSPAQCWAVMKAMSFTLAPTSWRNQTTVDWLSTCASEVLELNLMLAPRTITFPGRLPRFPKLRKVFTYDAPDLLSLIQGSPNLYELTVDITHYRYWGDLVSTIRSLPLKSLDIYFGYQLACLSRSDLMDLRTACTAVEHLKLRGTLRLTPYVWDMITGIPSLKKIGLHRDINDHHLPFLQDFPEVELTNVTPIGLQKVQELTTRVTGIFTTSTVGFHDIRGFQSFPNLRRLSIVPSHFEEGTLVGVIDNVEELSLSWGCNTLLPLRQRCIGSKRISPTYPTYHTPNAEVLENIMRSTPRLRSFKISNAIVKAEVIERLLEIAGDKLENFEVCYDWQNEPTVPRMQRILKAVARHCPNLRTMRFLETYNVHEVRILATNVQTESCLKALRAITEQAPNFLSYRNIRHIIQNRFVEMATQDVLFWDEIVPSS